MATMEMVEKLKERANITYEEARAALDACGDDLLEALIFLEKQGKVSPPQGGSYSSKTEAAEGGTQFSPPPKPKQGESFKDLMNRFFRWCGRVIHKGNTNYFEVWRLGEKILSVPITVLVLLLIFAFWVAVPLLVIGLFLSCRYAFRGAEVERIDMNGVMNSAADAAESLKTEVKNAQQQHQQNHEQPNSECKPPNQI